MRTARDEFRIRIQNLVKVDPLESLIDLEARKRFFVVSTSAVESFSRFVTASARTSNFQCSEQERSNKHWSVTTLREYYSKERDFSN